MSLSFLSQVYEIDEETDSEDDITVSGHGNVCKSDGEDADCSHQISICKLSLLCEDEVDIANNDITNGGDYQSSENGVGGEVDTNPLIKMGFAEGLMKTPNFSPLSSEGVEIIEDPMKLIMGGGFHHLLNCHSDISSSVKGDSDNEAYWARQRKSGKRKRIRNWKWSWDQEKIKQSSSVIIKDKGGLDGNKKSSDKTEDKVTFPVPKAHFICNTELTEETVRKVQAFKCPFCFGVFLEGPEFMSHLSIHLTKTPNKKTIVVEVSRADPIKTEIKERRQGKIRRGKMKMSSLRRRASAKCLECKLTFSDIWKLKRHMTVHEESDDRPWKCFQCKAFFLNLSSLRVHENQAHNRVAGSTLGSCNFCGKAFNCRWKLADHVRIHTGERPFKCPSCRKRFRRKDHVKKHLRVIHGVDASTVGTDFKPIKQLMLQSRSNPVHTNTVVQQNQAQNGITGHMSKSCSYCGKVYNSSWKLAEHIRIHSGERPFKCPSCRKRFRRKDHVKKHLRVIHGVDASTFAINLKPSQPLRLQPFIRPSRKTTLDEVRDQVEIRPCKVIVSRCDHLIPFYIKKKKPDSKVVKSVNVNGQGQSDNNNKKIQKKSSLQPSIKVEPGIDRQSLIRIRKTSGKNKMECIVCGKGFQQMFKAMGHVLIHTQEKPYRCPEPGCSKTFRWRENLHVHRRIHTGLKPYICNVCSKAFITHANLIAHSNIHTGLKPYKCRCCSQKFRHSSNLRVHMKSLHGG